MGVGFLVSGIAGAVQAAESAKLQEKLQKESIEAQQKMQEKQHEHDREMLKAQEAMYAAQQGNSDEVNQESGEETDDGYYDKDGNFHLSDGSGYVDKDGNFHLSDGSGYYDKDMNFHYSDGTGYLDKDGNFHLSDGSGYYDKDGNFYPSDKDGHYDKDGNYVEDYESSDEDSEDEEYEEDDRFEDAVLIEKNTDDSRKSTYAVYYEDASESYDEEILYENGVSRARVLEHQDRFEKYISDGTFTHRELQSIKENIEAGRMNFFTIEYMYEQDIFSLEQSNAALEMLQYFQTKGSF